MVVGRFRGKGRRARALARAAPAVSADSAHARQRGHAPHALGGACLAEQKIVAPVHAGRHALWCNQERVFAAGTVQPRWAPLSA